MGKKTSLLILLEATGVRIQKVQNPVHAHLWPANVLTGCWMIQNQIAFFCLKHGYAKLLFCDIDLLD